MSVRRDYVRPARNDMPPKAFYTVQCKGENVAVGLVEQGLATVVPHGANDERSHDYDLMLQAEQKAKAAQRGIHGKAEKAAAHRLDDLTVQDRDLNEKERNAKRVNVRKKFDILSKQPRGSIHAVVEFVINPTKLKVCLFAFSFGLNWFVLENDLLFFLYVFVYYM